MDNDKWEKIFAWTPVRCKGKKVWLRYVYRKEVKTLVSSGSGEQYCTYWIYKC